MIFRKKIVDFPAWNYEVVVVVSNDLNAASRRLNLGPKDGPPPASETTGGLSCHEVNEGRSYLFVKPNASVNTMAHESWHCIRRMLIWAGADFDSETVAYHIGYLTGQVYNFVYERMVRFDSEELARRFRRRGRRYEFLHNN